MANILFGVTGSVAAIKTSALYESLKAQGYAVKVVATRASLYFFDPAALEPLEGDPPRRNPAVVSLDEDEWPGRAEGRQYQRDDPVLHIELRRWADLFLIAPLDANTLAKLAVGLADNCLTCVWRAWEPTRPVVLAPAMNTLMWDHPLTRRHLHDIAGLLGSKMAAGLSSEELIERVNAQSRRLRIVPPESRRLACGDVGVGAMAAVERITAAVEDLVSR
jgi:phosphopantothenoylcysteine decarboxylase